MILAVDDHADTLLVMQRLLQHEGYEVVTASSGEDALAFLKTHVPQLVILDYRMPGMNGLTVVEHVRADARLAHVPLIMFSADDASLRERALAKGVNFYITKGSLDWAQLRKTVATILGPGGTARDVRRTPRLPALKRLG